ncbi:MAG: hypothetical protein GY940_03925 [bacterium]|nr:hypothetical protein [bacterium]
MIEFTKEEFQEVKDLLRQKHFKISGRKIKEQLGKIINSQHVFPRSEQRGLLIQLLDKYERTKKKEVIVLEESNDPEHGTLFVLGVLAEDWPGMSNSILGIVHHKRRNVRYIKGFTLELETRTLGVVILTFQLKSPEEYNSFIDETKNLIREIKDASRGSTNKYMLLDDEAVKFDIYNRIIKKVREQYHSPELIKIIEESGEILKFVSSRSREYLEDRKIKDLSDLILNNYIYQNLVKVGSSQEIVKIKNFKTKSEDLTGITFVCKEHLFSIEDFLKTLNHLVPNHIIKHHKSYVTSDGILIYRIEILDRVAKPLDSGSIKSIETSLHKLISIACSKKFSKVKSVGGFEHYARAIIPFLSEELKKTKLTQVFININSKTEFLINIKLIIVSFKSRKKRVYSLLSKLSTIPGIDIQSSIPPKIHGNKIEISILKLKVSLTEFPDIRTIYTSIKDTVIKLYGEIRDFDQGFRDIYIRILNQLLDNLKTVDATLIREIFFNIDELYKIEIPPNVLLELIRTCSDAVEESHTLPGEKLLVKYKQLPQSHRTVLVVSYCQQKRLLSRLVQKLSNVDLYFTQIEWNQRSYLIMILCKDNDVLDEKTMEALTATIRANEK